MKQISFTLIGPFGEAGNVQTPYAIADFSLDFNYGNLQLQVEQWEPACDSVEVYASWGNETDVDLII